MPGMVQFCRKPPVRRIDARREIEVKLHEAAVAGAREETLRAALVVAGRGLAAANSIGAVSR